MKNKHGNIFHSMHSRMTQMAGQADFNLRICQEYLHPGKGNSPAKENKRRIAIYKLSNHYTNY